MRRKSIVKDLIRNESNQWFSTHDLNLFKEYSKTVINRLSEYPDFIQNYYKRLPTSHPDKYNAGIAFLNLQSLKNRIHYINILSYAGITINEHDTFENESKVYVRK